MTTASPSLLDAHSDISLFAELAPVRQPADKAAQEECS